MIEMVVYVIKEIVDCISKQSQSFCHGFGPGFVQSFTDNFHVDRFVHSVAVDAKTLSSLPNY